MKLFTIIFATLISTVALAESADLYACLEQNDSTIGREECQHDEMLNQDKVLLNLAKQQKPNEKQKLAFAKWLSNRESTCKKEAAEMEGGTGQGFRKFECLTRITQERILQIQNQQPDPQ